MAKKKKSPAAEKTKQPQRHSAVTEKRKNQATMLPDSSSDTDSSLPPESEWNAEAKALKALLSDGSMLEKALKKAAEEDDEGDEFEEATLDDDHSSSNEAEADEVEQNEVDDGSQGMDDDDDDDDDDDEEEEEKEEAELSSDGGNEDQEKIEDDKDIESESDDDKSDDNSDNDDDDDAEETDEPVAKKAKLDDAESALARSKALQFVTASLVAEKKDWPWAETFHILPSTPLPFGGKGEEALNIHDDLKREVAFYDNALEAVLGAKVKCKKDGVPFSRPDDFFAEMVKTDEHMAKVKDRLIFETKKMEAVAQRKANKEQKLRAKESHSNKLAEKSKRKKDHFKAVEDWAQSAAQNRGRRLSDKDDVDSFFNQRGGTGPNKKRQTADKKYGHGGKRGRFKQNDPKSLNDMSGFNRNGNFGGVGTKKTSKGGSGAGANRKGKRARDARRSS